MSCSLNSNMLCYVQCNPQGINKAIAEKRVIVPVLCVCMIALQGSKIGMAHPGIATIAMAQQGSDAVTEHIGITQKQLFSTINSDKNLRG